MPKFLVDVTYQVEVEAEDEDEAKEAAISEVASGGASGEAEVIDGPYEDEEDEEL